MELSMNNLMSILEEADAISMRSINLSLTYIDYLIILKKLRIVECRFNRQYYR